MGRQDSAIEAGDDLLATLNHEMSAKGCGEFLPAFVEAASLLMKSDLFLVARLNPLTNKVRTVHVAGHGAPLENFSYMLDGTPCGQIIDENACTHFADVAERFPDNAMLREMGARSYVGAPLIENGQAVGIVAAISTQPVENAATIQRVLRHYTRRLTADLLRTEAAERAALAIRAASDGIWDWCMQTGMVVLSSRYCALLGLPAQEATVSIDYVLARVHADDVERLKAACQAHFDHDATYDMSCRLRSATGEYRWFRTRGDTVRDRSGEPIRMVGVITDIHDLVEARQQATEASRAKSKFLATMSHEIRTPLNGVLGMASLLGSTDLEASQRSMVDLIEESGKSLLQILNDVLDIANIESGRFEIEDSEYDPAAVLEMISSPFRLKAQEKQLGFHVEIDPETRQHLPGDPTRIRQILSNLISNAVKFTDRGEVRLRCLMAENADGAAEVRYEVCDTGIGIEAELQPHIFTPFVQAEPLMTRKIGGTGLGLAISKKLAELMKGDIELESEPGAGSVFRLCLPAAEAAASPAGAEAR